MFQCSPNLTKTRPQSQPNISQTSSLMCSGVADPSRTFIYAESERADEQVQEDVLLAKIDVEGSEPQALRSLKGLLQQHKWGIMRLIHSQNASHLFCKQTVNPEVLHQLVQRLLRFRRAIWLKCCFGHIAVALPMPVLQLRSTLHTGSETSSWSIAQVLMRLQKNGQKPMNILTCWPCEPRRPMLTLYIWVNWSQSTCSLCSTGFLPHSQARLVFRYRAEAFIARVRCSLCKGDKGQRCKCKVHTSHISCFLSLWSSLQCQLNFSPGRASPQSYIHGYNALLSFCSNILIYFLFVVICLLS